jgi:outer membrane protein OmpA-like peptidoglycan-associated protein
MLFCRSWAPVAWAALILLLSLHSALADEQPQKWLGFGLLGGYQWMTTSTGNSSMSGLLGGFAGELAIRRLSYGELSASFGFQGTKQSGTTGSLSQSVEYANPVLDLAYMRPLGLDRFAIGGLLRNQFGAYAKDDVASPSTFEWLISIGPRLEYRHSIALDGYEGELYGGLAVALSVTGGTQVIWQVPASVGVRLNLDASEKPRPEPAPVAPAAPEPSPVPASAPAPTSSADIAAGEIAQVAADGVKITLPLSRVSFDVGKASVTPEAQRYLDAMTRVFVEQSANWDRLDVVGHTDNRGPEKLNVELSHQRARAITRTMLRAGIAVKRLHSRGAGSSEPVDSANSEEGWKRNRRVEIHVLIGTHDPNLLARALNDFDRRKDSP